MAHNIQLMPTLDQAHELILLNKRLVQSVEKLQDACKTFEPQTEGDVLETFRSAELKLEQGTAKMSASIGEASVALTDIVQMLQQNDSKNAGLF